MAKNIESVWLECDRCHQMVNLTNDDYLPAGWCEISVHKDIARVGEALVGYDGHLCTWCGDQLDEFLNNYN